MINNLPQTISNDLLERISTYTLNNVPSEFEAKLLLNEADKVKNVDISESYMLKGIVYSLMGEYDNTTRCFNNSLSNCPEDLDAVVVNYAKSLRYLGKFKESFEIIDSHYNEGSSLLSEHAFLYSLNIGLIEKSKIYNEKFKKFSSHDSSYSAYLQKLTDFCQAEDVSSEDLHSIFLLVMNSVYSHRALVQENTLDIVNESNNSLIIGFYVDMDSCAISEIELDIAENYSELDTFPSLVHKIVPVILKCTD